jgi:hypothetical protein
MSTPDVTTLVLELRATLDHIGDALVNGSFDELIATESRLAGLVGGFGLVLNHGGPLPSSLPSELDEALTSLRRCQRLGTNYTELRAMELRTAWAGVGGSYNRTGRAPADLASPQTSLDTRA